MITETVRARDATELPETIARAAKLLRAGEIVALPTETVYGLAADALNVAAVVKIFEAKSRPRFDPLIVHIPARDWLEQVAVIPASARTLVERLAETFWPGPLTLVLPRNEKILDIVAAGLPTVAVRISAHKIFSEIISRFGGPLAAPSANRFGRVSPTTAAHVASELDGLIPLIVDGGPASHGIESTIVAVRNERIEVLRRGPITAEELSRFGTVTLAETSSQIEAPGQMRSHYAPVTPLHLIERGAAFDVPAGKRCGLLAFASAPTQSPFADVRILTESGNLAQAAANLFRFLRELDEAGLDLIVAESVPEHGIGAAINDRLRRASK